MSDELSSLANINNVVTDTENQLCFEKIIHNVKEKIIRLQNFNSVNLRKNRKVLEKKYIDTKKRKSFLEENLITSQQNNQMAEKYLTTLSDRLMKLKRNYQEYLTKHKSDVLRFDTLYNKQIQRMESGFLASERVKLQNLKIKYSVDIAILQAKIKGYKKSLTHYYDIQSKQMQHLIIRLAKYFDNKKQIDILQQRLETAEAKYILMLARNKDPLQKKKYQNDNKWNDKIKIENFEDKINFIVDISQQLSNMKQSPDSDDVIGTLSQTQQNNKIIQDTIDYNIPQSNTNFFTDSSFWNTSIKLKTTQVTQCKENQKINISEVKSPNAGHYEHKTFKVDNAISNKIHIIQNIQLNTQETSEILNKLPDLNTSNDISNKIPTDHTDIEDRMITDDNINKGISPNRENQDKNIDSTEIALRDSPVDDVTLINKENEDILRSQEVITKDTKPDDVTIKTQENVEDYHKKKSDVMVSKFFAPSDNQSKDVFPIVAKQSEDVFIIPAAKKAKIELVEHIPGNINPLQLLDDAQMHLQLGSLDCTEYDDMTLQSHEFDNTIDSDKSFVTYPTYAEDKEKITSEVTEEKKSEGNIAPTTSNSFFAPLFGGPLSKKPTTEGFSLFGKAPDTKASMPSFFSSFNFKKL